VTATAELISALVAGGMNAAEAAGLVARAAVEMTGALTRKSAGAARQQRYRERNKASQRDGLGMTESVTNRNETVTRDAQQESSQTVTKRNEGVTRDAVPLSTTKTDIENRKDKRGARLPPDWTPSDADRAYARSLGWTDEQIDREAEDFRDYWIARPGAGGLKLDWPATWRKWIRNSKSHPAGSSRPLTAHQQERETGREILDALRNASSQSDPAFQRYDPGNGPASLRGGVRGAIIDLSATRDRAGHEPIEGASFAGRLSEPGKVSGAS
jgi:hypothetical protein